jgi:F0F1-type ATP synthase membrane subunit b/b'
MKLRLRWNAIFAAVLFFLAVIPGSAAEGGGESSSPLGWTFRWIHFAIVFGLIAYLLIKKAPAFFHSRAESIAAAIADSSRGLAEGERRKRGAANKLAGLDKELAEMRAAARRDGAAEAERIRAGAGDEVAKIDRAAQAEITAAARAARSELKALAARLAVTRAQAQLEKQMTPASESAIFGAFVRQLAKSGAQGSRN